jgi:hypothetical protein
MATKDLDAAAKDVTTSSARKSDSTYEGYALSRSIPTGGSEADVARAVA